jgi:Tfp pilus assembly protein FimV
MGEERQMSDSERVSVGDALLFAQAARIRELEAQETTLRSEIEGLRKENAELAAFEAEVVRLANCLHAIHKAAPEVPASVLRGIAYDIVLNGIGPDVAEYQIERRAKSLLSTPNGPG